MGRPIKDYSGQIFYKVKILSFYGTDNRKTALFNCLCLACGKKFIRRGGLVARGQQKSCGCLRTPGTHRMSTTRFYRIWHGMRRRCDDQKEASYRFYGAKGITYSEKWKTFANFFQDMYESYLLHAKRYTEKNTTLDRIDNAKGYYAENCRWATQQKQFRNKTSNHLVEYKGKYYVLTDLAKKLNIRFNTLRWRLKTNWPIERLFSRVDGRSTRWNICKK